MAAEVVRAMNFQNSLTTRRGRLSLWVRLLGNFHSYPLVQGIELEGFELAIFDRRRELCFWLVYGDGDAKNARSSLYLRRNSARLGLGCREAQGEATVARLI